MAEVEFKPFPSFAAEITEVSVNVPAVSVEFSANSPFAANFSATAKDLKRATE